MNRFKFNLLSAAVTAFSASCWADASLSLEQASTIISTPHMALSQPALTPPNASTALAASANTTTSAQHPASTMVALSDEELSKEQGQAKFSMSYIAPGDVGNTAVSNRNIGFYTLGLEALLELNLNARNLQLGCGGVNGADGCDIDIQNISFGCIANSAGTCITLPKSEQRQLSGKLQETGAAGEKDWQYQMKDFKLKNPFIQFAVKNPNSASTREIVGLRLGAAQTDGPLSFGSLNQFSGFLSGKANLTMRGENNVGVTPKDQAYYQNGSAYLGLENDSIINILGLYTAYYRDVTVNYGTVTRNGLPVELYGTRQTQTQIPNVMLGNVVDELMRGLQLDQACVRNVFGNCAIISGLAGILLPVLKPGIGNYIKDQLSTGLGKQANDRTDNHQWLNNYKLPYNIKNVHQLDISSALFGIALSGQPLQYPGYDRPVNVGWSMYMPDAFQLDIDDKVSSLVSNISTSSNARLGDITLIAPPYRNCWGDLKFC